jgi:LmbE family N-acetylglucosaminyl deacetylase
MLPQSGKITAMASAEFIPTRVISIHAHPDDQEFTVAGTLALWARQGCQILSIIVTSGESGSNETSRGAEYKPVLASIREAEQTAACARLGIQETVFLHYPDGELEPSLALRREVTRHIRRWKPDAVVIGDPQAVFSGNGYINHPDHRAAAQAGLYAAFPSSGSRLIFPEILLEGLEPHDVKRVYIHGAETSDTWVDISASIDVKIEALREHVSQLRDWDPEKMMRDWAAEDGKDHGMAYAEAFKVMILSQETSEEERT